MKDEVARISQDQMTERGGEETGKPPERVVENNERIIRKVQSPKESCTAVVKRLFRPFHPIESNAIPK